MTDNEIIKASENTEVKKIKAIYPHIVVGGTADKPCYSIDWYNIETKTMHTGYSSYNLKIVQEWLKEYFEVVEGDIENLINRQKEEIDKLEAEKNILLHTTVSAYSVDEQVRVAKAEAYKEFAERLKETKFKHGNEYIIYAENIDTLLKEMVGAE